MQLPLYLFLDELSQTCTQISGAFDDDGALCDGVRLFSGDAVYEPNCLYVVQEEFMGDYFLFSKGHEFLPPAVLFCSGSADQFQIKNSVLCCSGESFFAFFNRLQSLCDRCSRLDLALTECNSRQAPYREYLDLCFPFIQNPIILYDHDYIIIADSRGLHPLPDDTDWINLTSAGYWTPEVRTTALLDMGEKKYPHNQAYYYDSNRFFHNFALMNMWDDNTFLSTICVHEIFTPITKSQLFFINHLGLKLTPRFRREVTQQLQAKDLFDRFLQSMLLKNTYSQEFIASRLQLVDWDPSSKYFVFGFADTSDVLQSTYFPMRMQNIFHNCRTVPVEDLQVTVVRVQDSIHMKDFPALIAIIRDSVVKCGVSSMLHSFSDITMGYRQVRAAIEVGRRIAPTAWIYEYEKFAIDYIVKFAMEDSPLSMLCHSAVLQLSQEDEANGTCYLDTLAAYLTCEKNIGKIAEELFIHRNTLMYRLEKIRTLTGIDYDDTEEMEHILLSIRILRLYRKNIFTRQNLSDL